MNTRLSDAYLDEVIARQIASVLDEKSQTTIQWLTFMCLSLVQEKAIQKGLCKRITQRIHRNALSYQKNTPSGNDWQYCMHQEHLLIQLANCMPKKLAYPLHLIRPDQTVGQYFLDHGPKLTPAVPGHYFNIHLVSDDRKYHLHLYSGSTPYACLKATPWTLLADVWLDVGAIAVSNARSAEHLRYLTRTCTSKPHILCIGHSLGGSIARLQTLTWQSMRKENATFVYHAYSAPGKIYLVDTLLPWMCFLFAYLIAKKVESSTIGYRIGLLTWLSTLVIAAMWSRKHLKGFPAVEKITLSHKHAHTKKQSPSTWTHLARYNIFSENLHVQASTAVRKAWYDESIEIDQRIQYPHTSKVESIVEFGHLACMHKDDSWWRRHMWTVTYIYLLQTTLSTIGFFGASGIYAGEKLMRHLARRR